MWEHFSFSYILPPLEDQEHDSSLESEKSQQTLSICLAGDLFLGKDTGLATKELERRAGRPKR